MFWEVKIIWIPLFVNTLFFIVLICHESLFSPLCTPRLLLSLQILLTHKHFNFWLIALCSSCQHEHGIMYYVYTIQSSAMEINFKFWLITWAWHDVLFPHTPIKCNRTQVQLLAHRFVFPILIAQHEHGMMYYFHTPIKYNWNQLGYHYTILVISNYHLKFLIWYHLFD